MAYRDRSQGFGFVYVDLARILEERGQLSEILATEKPTSASMSPKVDPILEIKKNLERLQSLHEKLHGLLKDLNSFPSKKTKR